MTEPGPDHTSPHKIAIIGAGISGLAAAWTLHQRHPSCQVTLFEASNRAGGVLETINDPPYLIERSADNFATLLPDALELCKATGYEQELISPQAIEGIQQLLQAQHVPANLIPTILKAIQDPIAPALAAATTQAFFIGAIVLGVA
ncbi:MAG: FAD-dependent oxidoreductase, partial [Aureliella sp.]